VDRDRSLKPDPKPPESNRRAVRTTIIVVFFGAAFWLLFHKDKAPPEPLPEQASTQALVEPRPVEPPPMPSPPAAPPVFRAAPEASKPEPVPYDQNPGMPSHPITPEHERIARENSLIQQMNDAMDLKDGARLRKLVGDHAAEFPEDANQLREGYEIVADCLEHPGPATTRAGERFFEAERGSTLRRFVKRHCIDAQP
jgi:hypothetical protein